MTFSIRNVMTLILLLLAATLSIWSFTFINTTEITSKDNDNQPDAFMENIIATYLNKEGKPTLKIFSPSMLHFSENNTSRITKPHVIIYRNSPKPWFIDSDYANANNGAEKITFLNNVVIQHPSDVNAPATTINTDSLTVFPDKEVAETAQAIILKQPDVVIHAVGMLANLSEGTVKLLSNAKGEYAPAS